MPACLGRVTQGAVAVARGSVGASKIGQERDEEACTGGSRSRAAVSWASRALRWSRRWRAAGIVRRRPMDV